MEIQIRLMEPSEAAQVQKIGRRAFSGLEGLGVAKPKHALVAVCGGEIVGAIQCKFYFASGKKIGYFDYAFIHPDHTNQGIGNILYKAVTAHLWEQGCDALTALVKDDNVGSWSLLQKNGFGRISLPELARHFGLAGALRLYFGTMYGFANGMDYYVALPNQESPSGKGGSAAQMAAYLLANLLLFLFLLVDTRGNPWMFLGAYAVFLLGGLLVGYAGTLFSKQQWNFRFCSGGGLVCALINLIGGIYPMVGNWYPKRYENTDSFRRDMGLQALAGWIFVLALTLFSLFVGGGHAFFGYLARIGLNFLLYRILVIYPFEAFGGARVYRWNKWIYALMAAASLALCVLA